MRNISGQDKPAFKYRLIQFPCVFNMFFFFFKRNYISEEHHGTWYKKYTETPGKIKNELSGILNHSRGPFCIANNVIAYCYIYIYILYWYGYSTLAFKNHSHIKQKEQTYCFFKTFYKPLIHVQTVLMTV